MKRGAGQSAKRRLVAAALLSCIALAPATAAPAPDPVSSPESQGSLFVIRYEPGAAWKPGRPLSEQGLLDHFRYLKGLHAKGLIVLAGPAGADGGIIVLRARDAAEAAKIMRDDPAVAKDIFVGSLRPFSPVFVGEPPTAVPPR